MPRFVYQPKQLDQENFSLLKKLNYIPNVIYDIGGSDGHWSKAIYEIFPSTKYYLFEPLADTEKYSDSLCITLDDYPSFELHKFALGDKEEEVIIKIFPDNVSSTTLPFSSDSINYKELKIPCLTVESAIKKLNLPVPNVIKISS